MVALDESARCAHFVPHTGADTARGTGQAQLTRDLVMPELLKPDEIVGFTIQRTDSHYESPS